MADAFAPPDPTQPALGGTSAINPYEETLAIQDSQRTQRLRTSLVQADQTSPDRAADIQRLTQQTGIPGEIIDRNYDVIRARARLAATPYHDIAQQTPALAEWASQPANAQVSHDDMEAMGTLEWILKMPARAIAQTLASQGYGALRTQSMFRELSQEEHDLMQSYKYQAAEGGALGVGPSWVSARGVGVETIKLLTMIGSTMPVYGLAGAAAVGTLGAIGGTLVEPGGGTIAGAVAGARLGFTAGNTYGLGKMAFQTAAGATYDEFLETPDEFGRRMDPQAAKVAALAYGVVNAGLMTVGGTIAKGAIEQGTEKIAGALTRDAVKVALRQPSVRKALADAAARYGKTLTEGAAIGLAMEGAKILAESIGRAASPALESDAAVEPAAGEPRPGVGERLLHAAVSGAAMLAGVGAYHEAASLVADRVQIQRARQNVAVLEALGGVAANSKTLKRAPDAVQAFVERVTKNGPVETVYAPTDTWAEYWQSKGLDPAEVAAQVTGSRDAYRTAEAQGRDLPIPTARYAAVLAGTEHHAFFANELRLGDPEALNGREADAVEQRVVADVEAQIQAAQAAGAAPAPPPDEWAGSAARAQILDYLQRTGYTPQAAADQADLYGSLVGNATLRAGVDPAAFFDQYNLRVSRPDLEAAGVRTDQPVPSSGEAVPATPEEVAAAAGTVTDQVTPEAVTTPAETVQPGAGEPAPTGTPRPAEPTYPPVLAGEDVYDYARRTNLGPREAAIGFRGGQAPDRMTAGRAAAEPTPEQVAAERERAERAGQLQAQLDAEAAAAQTGSDAERPAESRARARATRLTAGDRIAPSVARDREVTDASGRTRVVKESPTARAARAATHYDDVFRVVYAAARELDPAVNRRALHKEFNARVEMFDELQHDYRTSEADPRNLLRAIAGYGGLAEKAGGQAGEIAEVKSGTKFGALGGVQKVFRNRTVDSRGVPVTGLPLDLMLQHLQQTGEFRWLENTNQLLDALDEIARNPPGEDYLPGTDELYTDLRIDPSTTWWADAVRGVELTDPADFEGAEQILDPDGPVDTSFNVDEFNQSLFDDIEPPDPTADRLTEDTLDTGEVQPRLPEAGAVRDQDVATPELEAPFALTSEIARPRARTQDTLFQTVYHGTPRSEPFEAFSLHAIGSGEGNQAYGYGLYFASQRAIAEHYRTLERPGSHDWTVPGAGHVPDWVARRLSRDATAGPGTETFRRAVDALLTEFKARVGEAEERVASQAPQWWNDQTNLPGLRDVVESLAHIRDTGIEPQRPGRLYTVDIPDDEHFLDYDKPLSQQSPRVQAALERLGIHWTPLEVPTLTEAAALFDTPRVQAELGSGHPVGDWLDEGLWYVRTENARDFQKWFDRHAALLTGQERSDTTGGELYDRLQQQFMQDPERYGRVPGGPTLDNAARGASEQLAAEGLAGVRYLDGWSRGSGEGSRNYVVFDPALAPIVEYDQAPIALTPDHVDAWAQELKARVGPDLTAFDVSLTGRGDLVLNKIVIDRGAQRAGLGSRVMQELTRFADLNGKRILLSPADRADGWGTTSRDALVRFYSRFGFVENAGRHRDFAISAGMYREPTAAAGLAAPPEAPMFYSRLTRAVEAVKQEKATGAQWAAMIANAKAGISKDEFAIANVSDLEPGKSYTRQEVLDYLAANTLRVEPVTLEGAGPIDEHDVERETQRIYDEARDAAGERFDDYESSSVGTPEARWNEDEGKWEAFLDDEDVGHYYDTEEQALEHAQEAADERLDEARDEYITDAVSWSDAEREARDLLEEQRRDEGQGARYSEYVEPGGEHYREQFLTLPDLPGPNLTAEENEFRALNDKTWRAQNAGQDGLTPAERDRLEELKAKGLQDSIRKKLEASRGWHDGHDLYDDVQNPIVRLRVNDRTDTQGRKILFLEEAQPPHPEEQEKMPPLVRKNWRELAFKWAIRQAAEGGYDAVAWTTGEQQAARYGLERVVKQIDWRHLPGAATGMPDLIGVGLTQHRGPDIMFDVNREGVIQREGASSVATPWVGEKLEAVVGKELADKILGEDVGTVSGEGLKVGGAGLKRLYDVDFKNVVNNLPAVKKLGARVGTTEIQFNKAARYDVVKNFGYWRVRDLEGQFTPITYTDEAEAQKVAANLNELREAAGKTTTTVPSVEITKPLRDAVMAGQALFQTDTAAARRVQTETPAFRRWFGDSQVVDDQGEPEVLYHGTTRDFETFKPAEHGNIESDFGRGIYLSNNPADVGSNYANQAGPDLEAKIERRAEQLMAESDGEPSLEAERAFRDQARAEFVQHGGATVPVYLKLEHPVILGGDGETRLEMEHPVDAEGEPLDEEPTGTLIDFTDALRDVAGDFHDVKIDEVIGNLLQAADYESLTAERAVEILKADEGLMYTTDDQGELASSEIIRQAFERAGYDGIINRTVDKKFGSQRRVGKSMAGMDEDTVHYIAFSPEQVKSAIGNRGTFDPREPSFLRQEGAGATPIRKGVIRLGPGRQVSIDLLERADLSTFLHESGHFFLEVFGDLTDHVRQIDAAARTASQNQLLTDYAGLLKHLGVETRGELGRDQHEEFARTFEAYLGTGKAPSVALEGAFTRFRAWLLEVYGTLKRLNVRLTPEVTGILDRLVASDRAIQQAEARRGLPALFTTPEAAGMTPAQFALYRDTITKAHRRAVQTLDEKLLADVKRQRTAEWQQQRGVIEDQVKAGIHQQPVYRALYAMQRGTEPNGDPIGGPAGREGQTTAPMRLSRQVLLERFGAARLRRLPPFVYTREGGLDPDTVAGYYGYSSGDQLLTAIEAVPPMRAAIQQETARRMVAAHGDLLLDGTLHEQAAAALANDRQAAVIRAELKALGQLRRTAAPFIAQERATGAAALREAGRERAYERRWLEAEAKLKEAIAVGKQQVEIDALRDEVDNLKRTSRGGAAQIRAALAPDDVLRAHAQAQLQGQTVRAIRPELYWTAARRAGQAALDRAARQDFDAAITAKQNEIINLHLYREATRLQDDVEARTTYAKSLSQPAARKRIGKAGGSYLEQIDGILDRYEFAAVSQKTLDTRADLRAWADGLESQGIAVDLPAEVLDEARRKHYSELTVEQLQGVTDALQQIDHLASTKGRLLKAAADANYVAVRDAAERAIRAHSAAHPLPLEFRAKDARARTAGDWIASHRKLADLTQAFDGYQDGGAFWTAFIAPINAASDAEASRKSAAATAIGTLLTTAYPGRELGTLHERQHIPAINASLSKEARLALALNWGNETSRARVLADPVRKWNPEQVEAILDTLDKRDWDFVQAVWQHVDTYWPEIAAKQQRVVGVAPEKVEAVPVQTKYGEYAGGYYPLKYDGRLSPRAGLNEAASQAKLGVQAAYVRNTTKRGHVEARLQHVQLPIRLELGVLYEHVEQVLHDLTHHEMLIDTTRLIRDPAIAKAIYETRGDQVYQQFTRGLQDIAIGSTPAARNQLEKAANYMRTGTQLAMLGFNVWTAAQQPLGVFNGMDRVGVKWVLRGMTRWMRDAATLESTTTWINDVSPMMRERHGASTADLHDLRASFRQAGGWFDQLVRQVSGDTVTQQTITDAFLWHIGLMQRVADVPTWLGQYEKSMAGGEPEARAIALADQAVLDSQGGGTVKDLAQIQRGGPLARLWMTFYSYGNVIFNATSRNVEILNQNRTPAGLGTFLGHLSLLYLMPAIAATTLGHAFGRLRSDDVGDWLTEAGTETLATALNTVVLGRELAQLVLGQGARGYEGPAGARSIQTLYKLGNELKQGTLDEGLWKAALATGGVLFRFPAAQVQRTIDGYAALESGKTANPFVLLVGPPKKQAAK